MHPLAKLVTYPLTAAAAGFTGGIVWALYYTVDVKQNDSVIHTTLYRFENKNLGEKAPKIYMDAFTLRFDVPKTLKLSRRDVTTRFAQSFFSSDIFNLERRILSVALKTPYQLD